MTDSDDSLNIPTVDLGMLFDVDRDARAHAAASILEGFGTYGLVYVSNHGVDFELRDRLFERFAAFCAQPESDKQPFNRGDLWYQRGWTPPNTERAVASTGQPDFKECYFAAPLPTDPDCRIEYPQIYAENIWPEGKDEFRDEYTQLGWQIHEAGLALLQGVAMALRIPERSFDRKLDGGPHVFRLLKYLPLTKEQIASGVVWGEEHTDFNLLTILPGGQFLDPAGVRCDAPDSASGLFLRTRPTKEHPNGIKVQGKAPPGCVVAQVGQQLEILTGGAMLATPHVITAPATPGYARMSAAHFLHLHSHQIVFPLDKFRTQETLRAYSPPVLAGTYSIKTLVDIGLAPPSALDRLGYRHYDRLANMRKQERA